MEKTIEIPQGIDASVEGFKVKVKGKLGELERNFYNRGTANILKIERGDKEIKVSSKLDNREGKALVGTTIAHISNLFEGVSNGYKYKLKVVYTHFPISLKQEGDKIVLSNFLGQKGNKKVKMPSGVKVDLKGADIEVSGLDKELVGQAAATLEKLPGTCKNDKRRFQDGIYIVEKAK